MSADASWGMTGQHGDEGAGDGMHVGQRPPYGERNGVYVVQPGGGERIAFGEAAMTVKAAGAETGGAFTLIEVVYPAGFATPLHVHHREDESFYVLEGEVDFTCGDETSVGTSGSFVVLPRHVPHQFTVAAGQPARMLLIGSTAGLKGFFRQASEEAARGASSGSPTNQLARVRRAARSYGLEILAPASAT